jgi:DNA-binding MarR family transcriptional regulator
MSDQALETAAPAVSGPGLDLVALSLAVGNPVRWRVLQMLATEGPKSVTDLAARTNRLQHSMTKHMQVLRAAGAVVMVPGTDGRPTQTVSRAAAGLPARRRERQGN